MIDCEPSIKAHIVEIMYDTVFLNPVPNAEFWFAKMNKGDESITLRK